MASRTLPLRALLGALLAAGLVASACDSGSGGGSPDTGVTADTAGDTGAPDTGEPDTGNPDDTGPADTAGGDTAEPDGDPGDTGAPDSGPADTAGDTAPDVPVATCPEDVSCDDGLACTVDACTMPGAVCSWTVVAGTCLINGVCRADGELHPLDPCRACDAAADPLAWSPRPEGAACDDGDVCTLATTCQGGACLGTTEPCSDGNPCTLDVCNPASGCESVPIGDGDPCSDGDLCTEDDVCSGGTCTGAVVDCDDGDPCTDDGCDPALGCTATDNAAPCEDGDLCTAGDACAEGTCVTGPPANCDDGNLCTLDLCKPQVGCVHLPLQSPCCIGQTSICDDGNPCTTDLCDPATSGCSYENNTAACNDGNQCTVGDVCADGKCGGAPKDCGDGNPCTEDACSPGQGCFHTPLDGAPCDDGLACSTGDACVAGQCVADTSECKCTPVFSADAAKAVTVALGVSGDPGEGLDLDDDPSTCAPDGDCSGGINNGLGILAGFANEPLQDAIADGSVMLVTEFRELQQGPFLLAVYQADLDPANAGCDFQTQTCGYLVDAGMVDPETCQPVVSLPATLTGSSIVAGGPDTVFPFDIPLQPGVNLTIALYSVRFEGTATLSGGQVVALQGILGGAVPKTSLLAAIDALPPDGLPVDPSLIKLFVNGLDADIDTNGDGTKDALSIGLKLTAIDATIVGVAP